jgi:hypothetical protein
MKQVLLKSAAMTVTTLLALSMASAALAQYVWLDDKGVKQYSDVPPPASVPAKRILKAPGLSAHPSYSYDAPVAAGEDSTAKAAPTIAEKNADFMKRKIELAEKDKKTAAEAKAKADQAKNCDRAREYQQALDSGVRLGQVDPNGERSFMTDEQRTKETQGNKQYLAACK